MSVAEIELDPETGELLAPAAVVEELLAAARSGAPLPDGELAASGALADGALHPRLELALRIAGSPLVELRLERGEGRASGWLALGGAVMLLPLADGRRRLVTLDGYLLPLALVRLVELRPRPAEERRAVIALTSAELARAVETRDAAALTGAAADEREALGRLLEGLHARWRVEAHWTPSEGSPGKRSLEVLDSDAGLWRVAGDAPGIELWPATPTTVFRLLCGLLPADPERGG